MGGGAGGGGDDEADAADCVAKDEDYAAAEKIAVCAGEDEADGVGSCVGGD